LGVPLSSPEVIQWQVISSTGTANVNGEGFDKAVFIHKHRMTSIPQQLLVIITRGGGYSHVGGVGPVEEYAYRRNLA
jgi:hypothetical protein